MIAIVDDDAAVRDSLGVLLECHGYVIQTYVDAESFLSCPKRHLFAGIVADLRLPGATGLAMAAQLRAQGIVIPLAMISGHGQPPTDDELEEVAPIQFFEKPCHPQNLIEYLESMGVAPDELE